MTTLFQPHLYLAIIDAPIVLVVIGLGVLLFGADKLPKLARGMGQAKREFMVGQAEADVAAEKAREDARKRMSAEAAAAETHEAAPPQADAPKTT
ncbi:MAG TPA: twin-arginine translocase TatA/TatE family subunit [Candidatus Dormibacteraeota bacterium]|nr:twin-arginine translocase TatA/TatE family subunit [Candidatus Dormibacteraeota bacterium]